jgi:hypothetical protein
MLISNLMKVSNNSHRQNFKLLFYQTEIILKRKNRRRYVFFGQQAYLEKGRMFMIGKHI